MKYPAADSKVERGRFYEEYGRYCEENERQSLTRNGFFKNLRNKGFVEVKSNNGRFFKGLAFQEDEFLEVQSELPFD